MPPKPVPYPRLSKALVVVLLLGGSAALAGDVSYEYDELNRLTRVDYEDGTSVSYSYDRAGNRLSRVVSREDDEHGIRYAASGIWCAPGEMLDCDDNCPAAANPDQADQDGDGVGDACDNCVVAANARLPVERLHLPRTGDQLDADLDGFGNACDPDLNGDGIVNFLDLSIFKTRFLKVDAVADLTGDGLVNFLDLARTKAGFLKPPGPRCESCRAENER